MTHAQKHANIVIESIWHMSEHFALNAFFRQHVLQVLRAIVRTAAFAHCKPQQK
jgi:hypothetical protein